MTDQEQTPEAAPAPAVAIPDNEKLSLADLNTMIQIINVCGTRGAIRANEMSAVGALHNKLQSFLIQAGILNPDGSPKQAPAADATEAEGDTEAAPAAEAATAE